MANHITNRLTVKLRPGASPLALQSFTIQAGTIDPDYHTELGPDARTPLQVPYRLSFWNFKRPDPAMMDEYNDSSVGARNGWYDWNIQNWGTKWDAYNAQGTSVHSGSRTWLQYEFTTANSPPIKVLELMMDAHPDLVFTLKWHDEGGPGGEFQGADGIWHETDRFNSATSHVEAMESRRLVKCDCALTGGDHTPFSDCPATPE